MSRRRLAILASLAGLSALVVAMVAVRVVYTGNDYFTNLVWNLFLAWIPFGLAVYAYDGYRKGQGRAPALGGRRALAPVLPQRAVHRHRLQVAQRLGRGTDLVRRRARLVSGLVRALARVRVALPDAERGARRFRDGPRVGLRARDPRAGRVRRLPRTLRALELLGRLHASRGSSRTTCCRTWLIRRITRGRWP